ncbi:MAG: glycoside hydrolase family 2 TIM barrel-domain containing protein [Arachidicoccus sp.]|nr:glycoside hydrolase family 2 TIM barrel-domain containing protein [Arachidicoccus sp.]
MKKRSLALLTLIVLLFLNKYSLAQVEQIRLKHFQLQSSTQVPNDGKILSSSDYRPNISWYKAEVPSTVLTSLVKNNIYPDPYTGLNNMLIPDASDTFNAKYDLEKYSYLPGIKNPWKDAYWYRTSFDATSEDKGKTIQLIFDGINYRAEVWLNGNRIADSSQMVGMFRGYNFDISKFVAYGKKNYLAVKIYPLDFAGEPDNEQLKAFGPFFLNGGPTGDIGKNVTMLCSVGWDWVPPARDRNIGIWQPVYIRKTGGTTVSDIKLTTDLPNLPDTNTAKLNLLLSINNHTTTAINEKIKITIAPENFSDNTIQPFTVTQSVDIKALENKTIQLDASSVKEFIINHPKLWWPNGYGDPNLYKIKIQLLANNTVSDDTSFLFGIRTVSTKTFTENNRFRREFYVNGKKIHLVGGAWVPDFMLNRDSLRNDYELHLCQNANLNLIRIWGGGVTPEEPFWEACDRYGLLVWNDFWVTGDTQGEFKGSPDYPYQTNVYIDNVKSSILRVRNHPSLLVWTGGNEGHARKELYDAMRKAVIDLDGTRPYIPSSSGFAKMPAGWDLSYPDNQLPGVYSGGPYAWKDPKVYYGLADSAKDWGFKDETGIPSLPPLNTLEKIIPDHSWDKTLPFPFNNSWGYHDACTGAAMYDKYYDDMIQRYATPTDLDSFVNKMQLMNATGYQSIFEAANSKINTTGGVMLWKLNAAFPSVVWQIYDWYLNPNAGYYFMKKACEPLHIQFNQDDSSVAVINRSRFDYNAVEPNVKVYNIKGDCIFRKSLVIDHPHAMNSTFAFSLKEILKQHPEFNFIVLSLEGAEEENNGKIYSKNIYWTAKDNNYKALNNLSSTKLQATIIKSSIVGTEKIINLKVKNTGNQIAFFNHLQLIQNGEEVFPSFWSDNYFSLLPGEEKIAAVSIPAAEIKNKLPTSIQIKGWNTEVGIKNIE